MLTTNITAKERAGRNNLHTGRALTERLNYFSDRNQGLSDVIEIRPLRIQPSRSPKKSHGQYVLIESGLSRLTQQGANFLQFAVPSTEKCGVSSIPWLSRAFARINE